MNISTSWPRLLNPHLVSVCVCVHAWRERAGKEQIRFDFSEYMCSLISLRIFAQGSCNVLPNCKFKSTDPSKVRAHMQMHKRNTCDICGKITRGPSKLEAHKRVHTGERPYVCSVCDYRCTQKGHLTSHMEAQHPESELESVEDEPPEATRKHKGEHDEGAGRLMYPPALLP